MCIRKTNSKNVMFHDVIKIFSGIDKENLTRLEGVVTAYEIVIARHERKDPHRTPIRRCGDNIKMDFKNKMTIWAGFISGQGLVMCSCEYGYEPYSFTNSVGPLYRWAVSLAFP